jgi:hypothetical protein
MIRGGKLYVTMLVIIAASVWNLGGNAELQNVTINDTRITPLKRLDQWQNAREPEKKVRWTLDDGVFTNGKSGHNLATKEAYKDFTLSLEYKTSKEGTGNSGVYLRGRVEIQILEVAADDAPGSKRNGGIYGFHAPRKNAAKAVGEWNTLLVRFDGNKLTVHLNDALIHDDVAI